MDFIELEISGPNEFLLSSANLMVLSLCGLGIFRREKSREERI